MKYSEKRKFEKWKPKQTTVPQSEVPWWILSLVTCDLCSSLKMLTWLGVATEHPLEKNTFAPRLAPFLRFPNSICFLVSLSSSKLPWADDITSYHLPYFPRACFLQCIFLFVCLFSNLTAWFSRGCEINGAGKTLSFKDRSMNMFLGKHSIWIHQPSREDILPVKPVSLKQWPTNLNKTIRWKEGKFTFPP